MIWLGCKRRTGRPDKLLFCFEFASKLLDNDAGEGAGMVVNLPWTIGVRIQPNQSHVGSDRSTNWATTNRGYPFVKIFVQRLFQRQHFWREKIRSRDWYDLDWLTLCPIQLVIQTRSIWDQSYKNLSSLIHWKKQPIGALKTSLRGKFTRENLFTRSGHFKNGIFHQLEGANVTLMGQYLRPDQCDQKKVAKFL